MRSSWIVPAFAFVVSVFPPLAWGDAFQAPPTPPCEAIPAVDSLMGGVGVQAPCMPRLDASRPSSTQAAAVMTDGTGVWTVAWDKPFATVSPYVNVQPINTAGVQPYICNVSDSTATGATGKCWKTVANTVNILGAVLNPTSVAANIPVRVVARDTTQ